MLNPPTAHQEDVAEDSVEQAPVGSNGADGALCDNHIALFDNALRLDHGATDKSRVLDLSIERPLSSEVEGARNHPLDVIGEARQDLLVVGVPESIQVSFDGLPVGSHDPLATEAGTSVGRLLAPQIRSQKMIGTSANWSGNAIFDTSSAYRGKTRVVKELTR